MSSDRIARSLTILVPLLSWAQRDGLSGMFLHPATVDLTDSGGDCPYPRLLLRFVDFFEPTNAILRGTECTPDEVLGLLCGADRVALERIHSLIREHLLRSLLPEGEELAADGVVLECLGALVRTRLDELAGAGVTGGSVTGAGVSGATAEPTTRADPAEL